MPIWSTEDEMMRFFITAYTCRMATSKFVRPAYFCASADRGVSHRPSQTGCAKATGQGKTHLERAILEHAGVAVDEEDDLLLERLVALRDALTERQISPRERYSPGIHKLGAAAPRASPLTAAPHPVLLHSRRQSRSRPPSPG